MKTIQKFRNNRIIALAYFSRPYPTYLFSLQLPRQILLVDELGWVKRTGFLPIIFSAYLVDLSVDTTVLWQLKHCNIRTSWNRLEAFIKAIWKPHVGDVGEPVQIRKWMQTFAILCSKLKSSGALGCRTEFGDHRLMGSWRWRSLCLGTGGWPKLGGSTPFISYWENHYAQQEVCNTPLVQSHPLWICAPLSLLGRNWSLLVVLWLENQNFFIFLGVSLDGLIVRLEGNSVGS